MGSNRVPQYIGLVSSFEVDLGENTVTVGFLHPEMELGLVGVQARLCCGVGAAYAVFPCPIEYRASLGLTA